VGSAVGNASSGASFSTAPVSKLRFTRSPRWNSMLMVIRVVEAAKQSSTKLSFVDPRAAGLR
jgi:hypothetical protein